MITRITPPLTRFALLAIAGLLGTSTVLGADPSTVAPPADRQYVAVVIGISDYVQLPEDVELKSAATDAKALARTLQGSAKFNHVFTLTDSQATKARITSTFTDQVKPLLQPDDMVLVFIEAHGMGADLGMPILLAHDSTLESAQKDGFELTSFARNLQTWLPTNTAVIATDLIHAQTFEGLPFYGPAASNWPSMPKGTLIVSATQVDTPATEGVFSGALIAALSGGADLDYDTHITQTELVTYLVNNLAPKGQLPLATGTFDANAVIATGFEPPPIPDSPTIEITADGSGGTGSGVVSAPTKPEVTYPDITIKAAKFVFQEGDAQSVQCRNMPVKACTPSCYVRDFKAGPCTISAVVDGVQMTEQVPIFSKGKYDCQRKAATLGCEGPFL